MTQDEVVGYLERLLPTLREKTNPRNDREDEAFQYTVFTFMRKASVFKSNCSEKEFVKAFGQFYWWCLRYEIQREARDMVHFADSFEGVPPSDDYAAHPSYNPFDTVTTNALEYIELISDDLLREIAYLYYIEGYTYTEIGELFHHQEAWARKKTEKAIDVIKYKLLELQHL